MAPAVATSAVAVAPSGLSTRHLPSLPQRILPQEARPVLDFCAGATAGVVAATLTYPLDVLKTSVQMGGIRGTMLSGLPQHLAMVAGQQSIKFGVFATLQRASDQHTSKAGSMQENATTALFHGAMAGMVQSVLLAGVERWKTLRQVHGSGLHLGAITAQPGVGRLAAGAAGLRFWAHGLPFCMIRDVGLAMTLFTTNRASRDGCAQAGVSSGVGFTVAAVLSGGLAAMVVTPFDMVRAVQHARLEPQSARDAVVSVYRRHGLLGFTRGASLRFARLGAQYLITFNVLQRINDTIDQNVEFQESR